jgi:hypothetical protein
LNNNRNPRFSPFAEKVWYDWYDTVSIGVAPAAEQPLIISFYEEDTMKFVNQVRQSLLLVVACVLVFGISDVHAFTRGDMDVYALAESFTWREFNDAGGQLLKESGPRYGVGFAYAHEFPNHLTLKPRIELNGGSVDYDGQNQVGVPVTTTTNYFGVKFEFDLAGRIRPSQGFVLEPFAGIGIRSWARDIKDGTAADGSLAIGYTESWSTFYGRLGVRGEQSFGQGNNMFLLAGVKLPVRTTNYIDDTNISSEAITLKPGNKPSLFAEAGVKLQIFKISAFYDSMRFKKSPIVITYDTFVGGFVGYYQPKSESDMIGLKIGASF